MSLSWKEIDAVLSELDLVGSHIQKIMQPDFRNIVMELYGPLGAVPVLVALETGETRLHRAYGSPEKPEKRQRFAQFLHSRIKGGRIVRAEQINCDRIVRIDVVRGGENTILWIRLWGGAANMIATDESGTILDAFFRRPARGEVSGGHYFLSDAPETVESRAVNLDKFTSRFVADAGAQRTGPGSVNHKIAEYYRNSTENSRAETLRDRAIRALDRREEFLRARQAKLGDQEFSREEIGRMRLCGDLVLANLHRLRGGESWLETEDYSNDNQPIVIELNPLLRPQENAERFFERAKKASNRFAALVEEKANIALQLQEAVETRIQIDHWSTDRIEQFLERQERVSGPERSSDRPTPGLEFNSNGYRVLVGRNARENDDLLRHHVNGNDVWLHTRDFPGGYVFVKTQKSKSVPLEVLLDAGTLAVHYSRAKSDGRAELYYTFVKYLRRAKDGPRGLVLPTQEKNLSIVVESERIARLLGHPDR